MATALFLSNNQRQSVLAAGTDHSRVRVWLAKPESEIHQPFFKLLRQPRIRGEPANEKRELLIINWERGSRISKNTDRVGGKPLSEVILDRVHRSLNRRFEELRNFCPVCEKV